MISTIQALADGSLYSVSPVLLISTLMWLLVDLIDFCVPLVGILAAAILLWMLLTAEGKGKLGAIATIVIQVVVLLLQASGAVLALIAAALNVIFLFQMGVPFANSVIPLLRNLVYTLMPVASMLLCIALTVLAICVLRGKKAIAAEAAVLAEESTEDVLEEQIAENALEEQ